MRQYETFELSFPGPVLSKSWAITDVNAVFTHAGQKVSVPGFYDGEGIYKVRFLPEEAGEYRWQVSGTVQGAGTESCEPADSKHHGKVVAEKTAFQFADGSKYLPFGTTVYALAHQTDELVEQTLQTLAQAPFNKVRMCVFPKHYDFNHNEPPVYPFEKNEDGSWDVGRPCIAFWHRFEKILNRIAALDIQIDLILFHPYDRWGFAKLGMKENKIYLDYLQRRLAALPNIWWSLANEYDLMPQYQMNDWYEIEDFVAEHDPFHHLLSCHSCMKFYDFARPNITHTCLQTVWVEKADQWLQKYEKPVVYDEMCYEGNIMQNWGNISAFEMVNRFWCVCAKGAYGTHGETFLSQDNVLWWAAGGVLKGESPKRIAWLKDILYSLPGPLAPDHSQSLPPEAIHNPAMLDKILEHMPAEVRLFAKVLANMSEQEREMFMIKNTQYTSSCGEAAFLWYYARTCPGTATIRLPETRQYCVEVLDVWAMTRTTVQKHCNGSVQVTLPGKEGIAILATAE